MAIDLRRYQEGDLARLRRAYALGAIAVVYQLPTGGGKTIVFAAILALAVLKGLRCAVLVHRRELVQQASDKLTLAGVPHGIIGAGLDRDHDAGVLVMSVQSAARRLDQLVNIDVRLAVIDECHHAVAATYRAVLDCWPRAKRLGVSATPARLDGKGLGIHAGGLFDALVIGTSVRALQADGYLARTRCFVPAQQINTAGLRTRRGDWEAAALAERASVVTGDAVAEYRKHADHAPAIAYGVTVVHAESIADAFRAAGYRSACVHGGLNHRERDALIAGLGSGAIEVLTSCDLISEGLDVPDVRAVLLLRPTQSLVLAMQQIGRGMRPAPDKSHLVVLDFSSNVLRHGLPETERAWSLDGVRTRPRGEAQAPGWRCQACGCFNSVGAETCEECGAARPLPRRRTPMAIDGTLCEIDADHFQRITRLPYRTFLSKPRTERELRAYAQAHGYKRGWVWHRLQEQHAAAGASP